MKLLILNYEFPPLGGGAGNATKNIATEMAGLGHDIAVITTWFPGLPMDEVKDGYRVIRVKSLRKRKDQSNLLEMMDYVFRAIGAGSVLLKTQKYDKVVSFFAMPTGLAALYFKLRFKIPYILSLRGGDVPGFLPKNLKWHHRISWPLTKIIWRGADKIIANSEGLRKLAAITGDKLGKKIDMIPNGVNTEEFTPAQELSRSNEILFIGRLVEQKGVTYLLKAISDISKGANPIKDIDLCVVGDGPLMGALKAEAMSLGVSEKVSFLGWLGRDRLADRYRKARLFALPSFEEGMPNVVLEALASGLPIVASNVAGNDELVKDGINGILISDKEKIALPISSLLLDYEKCKRFGEASRRFALERGWRSVAESYIETIVSNK